MEYLLMVFNLNIGCPNTAESKIFISPYPGFKIEHMFFCCFLNFFIYTETTSDNLVFIVAPVQ